MITKLLLRSLDYVMKKSTITKLGIALFFLIVVLDSVGIIFENMTWRYIFKPLIMPVLLALYLITTSKVNRFYVMALCFAIIADALLLNSSNEFFVLAVGFFLLMHLAYIMIITNDIRRYKTKSLSLAAIPFFTVFVFVIFFVSNNINFFLWPIVIYGIVVCIFSALTFYNYLEKKTDGSLVLLLGSFFFIVSNSMSAIEKFRLQNRDLSIGIMFTYAIAQCLICMHMIQKTKGTQES